MKNSINIKNIIAPIQQFLLKNGQCVGCGQQLKKGNHDKTKTGEKVTCKCGRVYYYDLAQKIYRRALLSEV